MDGITLFIAFPYNLSINRDASCKSSDTDLVVAHNRVNLIASYVSGSSNS